MTHPPPVLDPDDRVHREPRLVWQEEECDQRAERTMGGVVGDPSKVNAPRRLAGATRHGGRPVREDRQRVWEIA